MDKAFCILAAGRGSRLGDLTSNVNKALLPIENKAAITHIIEKIPEDCEIVIAVGYDKEKVKEYCLAAHPNRCFSFVEVDRLEGPGSGPGYSLLCCKQWLQCPFYVCNVDTLIGGPYPSFDVNWLGVAYVDDSSSFATVKRQWETGVVTGLYDKKESDSNLAYIGLMGIKTWNTFWTNLEEQFLEDTQDSEFQYIAAFKHLDRLGLVYTVPLRWLDIGSLDGYQNARSCFQPLELLGLPKNINEITYKVNNRLIKLCLDSAKNNHRLARAKFLSPHVPPLVYQGRYLMAYNWVDGHTLYDDFCNIDFCLGFLEFCEGELWKPSREVDHWDEVCRGFYQDKTWERVSAYLHSRGLEHSETCYINGYFCQPVEPYITFLDWDNLCDGIAVPFHGDLQFDNVIYGTDERWYLIDWRESFGASPLYGDLYYDLAKLYAGLDVPFYLLKDDDFYFSRTDKAVSYSFDVDYKLVAFREMFESWIDRKGLDLNKVKTLAALVYINMAPLHPGRLGDLLFYHGVFRLAVLHDRSLP